MADRILTEDGSFTLRSETYGESYHSTFGALGESETVYMDLALRRYCDQQVGSAPIRIFEMGFGTGLNAIMTLLEALRRGGDWHYQGIEWIPLDSETCWDLWAPLGEKLQQSDPALAALANPMIRCLFESSWNQPIALGEGLHFEKIRGRIEAFDFSQHQYDVVFYDAFSPAVQPELWTKERFLALGQALHSGSLLSTYCVKGEVRRNLQEAGFRVSKHPGPPGKREVLLAEKL